MRETVRRAGWASVELLRAAGLALASYLSIGVVIFAAVAMATVVGAGVLPESVLLLRRTAGYKRRLVGAWTGEPVPEAYRPLRERFAAGRRGDPARTASRAGAHAGYGWLPRCEPLVALSTGGCGR
ncbi:hypothetical protein [Streptomyces rapamycinicus]|uniref:hypothetical protein n=1 Tax=Streptomyces rapamycinicus TaxID=1226757 RepID=UPI0032D994C6